MLVSWNWIKEYLGDTELNANEAADLLGMHAFEIEGIEEKENDTVIDVDVLPNRSSDCLSHRGIARELASITNTKLKSDPLTEKIDLSEGSKITLKVEDEDLCSRFTAAVITDVEVKPSPDWLKEKIELLGQRSINNVVDATNYVMFALGQPTHVFDFDKLEKNTDGQANITIRNARVGESLTLLSGEEIESDPSILHLVDGHKDTLLDLAGIKGGAAAELTNNTKNIVVTSGNFNYQSVRKTSQKLKISTDASQRFQNQPSPRLAGYGLRYTVELIQKIAGGDLDGMVDVCSKEVPNPKVKVSVTQTNKLLGLSLSIDEIKDNLERIGSEMEVRDGELVAAGPWERKDLQIAEDFIEEVGRIYGYEHVEAVAPTKDPLKEINKRHYYSEQIRQVLIEERFSEVITSSFRNKDKVQLRNALASDKTCLRSSLVKNLSEALDRNAGFTDLLGTQDTRMFEIGTVFYKDGNTVKEHLALTLGVRLKSSGYSGKEDKVITQVQEVLSDKIGISVAGEMEKGILEINLTELLEKLPDPATYEKVTVGEEITYQPFSVYQHMSRDIAMWVSEGTEAANVEDVLNKAAGDLRVRTTQFDEFTKDGRTSLGFRLVFQSNEKTLTDEEVNEIMGKVYNSVAAEGWEVR